MARVSRLRYTNSGDINAERTLLPVRRRIRSRGVPNALQEHPVACTQDLAEAEEVTSHLLGAARVEPLGPMEEFQCSLNAVRCLDVTLAYLDYAVATEVLVNRAADCFTVHMTTTGQASVQLNGTDHVLSAFFALVVSPGVDYRLRLAHDSPQMIVRIERAAMERQLSRMLGRALPEPIVFEPVGDLTTDAASRWTGALNILSAEVLAAGSLIHQGIGVESLEELIVSTLLYIQPSNYTQRLTGRSRRSGRPAVRRSIEYIEQHLAEPIVLADLVRHTGMSSRSIQSGFREDLDTTPVAFIRERRLIRVRNALSAAVSEDGLTVTEAAQRWGFTHLGSFSVLYRQRFGESPSQTLRRPR